MHLAGWYGVLRDAYAVEPYYLLARDASGRIRGVLPGYFSKSIIMGYHYTTLDGGTLTDCQEAHDALIAAVMALRDRSGVTFVQIRGGVEDASASSRVEVVHTVVSTSSGSEAAWAKLKQKTRWGVRQAEKQDVLVERDVLLEGMRSFYDVYSEHMHELGTPCFGTATFREMERHFGPDLLRLFLVRYRGELIGGMLCIVHGRRWTDLHAIVRRTNTPEYANYLLYWTAIRHAADEGAIELDFGQSSPGGNVHMFKKKWGGEDIDLPYVTYRKVPKASKPVADDNVLKKYPPKSLPRRIWSRMPIQLCNVIGPIMRRDLPFGLY
jgi:hypothetical protein